MPKHKEKTKHLGERAFVPIEYEDDEEVEEVTPYSGESDNVISEGDSPNRRTIGETDTDDETSGGEGTSSRSSTKKKVIRGQEVYKKLAELKTPDEVRAYMNVLRTRPDPEGIFRFRVPEVKGKSSKWAALIPKIESDQPVPPSAQPILPGDPDKFSVGMKETEPGTSGPDLLTLTQVYYRAINMTAEERRQYLDNFNLETLESERSGEISGLRADTCLRHVPTTPHGEVFTITPSTSSAQDRIAEAHSPPDSYDERNFMEGASFVVTGGYFLAFFIFFLNLIQQYARNDELRRLEEERARQRQSYRESDSGSASSQARTPPSRGKKRPNRRNSVICSPKRPK